MPRTNRKPTGLKKAWVPGAVLALLSLGAQAQGLDELLQATPRSDVTEADTLQLRAGAQWQHEDNVFLQPDNAAQSDNALVTTAGLRLNKPYSLQRIELDVRADNYRYDKNSQLDFTALNYNGAFRWAVTPKLRGNLTAEQREYTDRFSDTSATDVNRRTERQLGLDAEYEVGAAWRALAGVFERRNENTLSDREPDSKVRGGEVGARYVLRSNNSIAYRFRQGNGEYERDTAATGDFSETDHELELRWQPTGQVRVDGRLGWRDREHDQSPASDFDGWFGRLNATWLLTGKTSVSAGVIRELAAYRVIDASYYEGYRFYIAPEWKPTVKTAVRLRFDHGQRDYKGTGTGGTSVSREDKLNVVGLALEWEPIRALRLLATVQRDERDSSRSGLDYKANVYGISALARF